MGEIEKLRHELEVERQYVADMEEAYQERKRVEDGQTREQIERTLSYSAEAIGAVSFTAHADGMRELVQEAADLMAAIAGMEKTRGLAQVKRDAKEMNERLQYTIERLQSLTVSFRPMLPAVRRALALPEKT